MNRRSFLQSTTLATAGGLAGLALGSEPTAKDRKMTICLSCGSIGVKADQRKAIELAHVHGFESVEAQGDYLASLSSEQLNELLALMKQHALVFGAAGLSVEFRQDEARLEQGLQALPKVASGLERAGVKRVGTWLMPGHPTLTYLENFKRHSTRLRAIASVLKDHGLRLGLEYVGTRNMRTSNKFPFVRTMAEMRELIAAIGTGNVGLILDSWHWWMAGDTENDILALKNEDVVSVDLNDAPAGVAMDQQVDGRRELPLATGVINVGPFLKALKSISYDGPIRAEPFNKALSAMTAEEACATTAAAMKKAFALISS